MHVQGENVVGIVSQFPFFFLSIGARSEIVGPELQNPGETVGLRVPVCGFRKTFPWVRGTPSSGVSKKLMEPQSEYRLPQISPSVQGAQPDAGLKNSREA